MSKYIQRKNIPDEILNGNSEQLFDLIAETVELCARKFINDKKVEFKTEIKRESEIKSESEIEIETIGFTFSFPCEQHSLTSGTLIHWTKGFNVKGVEKQDVSKLLLDAINKRPGIKAKSVALLNDTVGTLLCGGQIHDDVLIGYILGTGMNAAYVEKCKNIKDCDIEEENMIINTEFGGFGSLGELKMYQTKFDKIIDKNSLRPGEQM